jgi:hypothetical protein
MIVDIAETLAAHLALALIQSSFPSTRKVAGASGTPLEGLTTIFIIHPALPQLLDGVTMRL